MISSLIGAHFYAITHLLSEIHQTKPVKPNQVQTGMGENGLACAIVTLSVFCLEAVLNRIRNVRGDTVDKNDKANYLNNKQYIELLVKDPKLGDIADELFAIRDAIAHNHLWSAQISWNKSGDLQFVGEPQLTAGYGNERFRKVTNLNTRKTNKLDLNVFPNRIWRRDAYIVFKNVYLLLKAFEETNRNYIYFSHMPYLFMDEMISIEEIAARIQVPSE